MFATPFAHLNMFRLGRVTNPISHAEVPSHNKNYLTKYHTIIVDIAPELTAHGTIRFDIHIAFLGNNIIDNKINVPTTIKKEIIEISGKTPE